MADYEDFKPTNNKHTVLSVGTSLGFPESLTLMLDEIFNTVTYERFNKNREKYGKYIEGCIFCPIVRFVMNKELLDSMPNLKVFGLTAAGYEAVDLDLLKERGIKVFNIPDVQSDACADMVIALMLNVSRRIIEGCTHYRREIHCGTFLGREVNGSTIGILGMGSIGCKVAERAKGFRMTILYHNRRKRFLKEESELGAVYVPNLNDLLPCVDFLVICCPLSSSTKRLIGAKELEMMKSSAVLVNISRGAVVDTDDLVDALRRGVIGGAGLDVSHPEPLPEGHPLFDMPNVTITPHMGSATIETRRTMMQMCIKNLLAGIEGRLMTNL